MDIARTHDYWEQFYKASESSHVPIGPSDFARWAASLMVPGSSIVEFGFGTGRDALWFATNGHPVLGFDFASSAVQAATYAAIEHGDGARFLTLNLDDERQCKEAEASIANFAMSPSIYGRFLIHALSDGARENFLSLASTGLARGGQLFLEFRTGLDASTKHVFGEDHFRKYLRPDDVTTEIRALGGTILHLECGHGLAKYREEDPHIARVVATWSRAGSTDA